MSRRAFGRALVGLFLAVAGTTFAQSATVVHRIGILGSGAPQTPEQIQADRDALREFGWVEGQNLHIERRYANNRFEDLAPLAEELVRAKVELIWTGGTTATLAAKRATTTIPIVFSSAGDPVLLRLVASLARPGGNVTGFSLVSPEIEAKRLTVLKEVLPTLRRIGVLESSANPYFHVERGQFEHTCQLLGLEPVFVEIAAASQIEDAFVQFDRQRVQALVLRADPILVDNRFEIARAALNHRLPTMAEHVDFVREAGALISYTTSQAEQDRRSASQVDRILRGARPADIPVEQPTQFELMINLKTAQALGVTIPQSLLLRANEVIR